MKRLGIDGQRIVNEDGEQVILHGINFVCKDKELGFVTPCDESLFAWFKEQGFNVLRMGLIWDGVEPEPGVYDDAYLARIKQQIKWAERHDIYVFLDMHQDLYSQLYADGAPAWATITNDLPHVVGSVWSDAYLASPAVNCALDHFWHNAPAPDGLGLQEHYAAMWAYAAQTFADCPNVIGYDLMNEPYPGSSGQDVFGAIIVAYAQEVMGLTDPDMDQLASLWFDEEKKQEVLTGMADMNIYSMLVNSAKEVSQQFEREILTPFFSKVAAGIRSVDPTGFIMLETSYFANMAIESGLELARDASGQVLSQQVYVPHGYDLVVDTEHYEIYNQDRVELIFATHRKVQERLQVPALIGEWGAFTNHTATYELTVALLDIFERYLWSNTYWCWCDTFQVSPYSKALNRAYPQQTSGELLSYHYDHETANLQLAYIPSEGTTTIYYPNAASLSVEDVVITRASVNDPPCEVQIQVYPNAAGGQICIATTALGDGAMTVEVGIGIGSR